MKDWWKYFLKMAVPMVEMAGEQYVNKDADNVGTDDLIGQTLEYIAKLGQWVLDGGIGKPPATPPALK